MATVKKVTKIADKLEKVSDNFTVYRYDNGYGIEISGRDSENDWTNAKIVCTSLGDLNVLIAEAVSLPLD